MVDRDSRNLVNTFMRVTNYMTRHLAIFFLQNLNSYDISNNIQNIKIMYMKIHQKNKFRDSHTLGGVC